MRKEPLCNHQWAKGRCLMCRWKPPADYWKGTSNDRTDGSKRRDSISVPPDVGADSLGQLHNEAGGTMIYRADDLAKNWPQVGPIDGQWVLARPLSGPFWWRVVAAWRVLTGE